MAIGPRQKFCSTGLDSTGNSGALEPAQMTFRFKGSLLELRHNMRVNCSDSETGPREEENESTGRR
jgi:hypothetical protein